MATYLTVELVPNLFSSVPVCSAFPAVGMDISQRNVKNSEISKDLSEYGSLERVRLIRKNLKNP